MKYFEEGEDEPSHRPNISFPLKVFLLSILKGMLLIYFGVLNVILIYFLIQFSAHYGEPQTYLFGIYQFGLAFMTMPTSTNDVGPLMLIAFFMESHLLLSFLIIFADSLEKFYYFLKKHKK